MAILPLSNLKPEGHMWTTHQVTVPEGHSIEDLLRPDYWAHVAQSIRGWDYIHCRREDREFDVLLEVIDGSRNWVKVRIVSVNTPDDRSGGHAEVAEPVSIARDQYRVEFKGPVKKHCVIRKSDNEIIKEGISLKGDAEKWLASHMNALAQ